MKMTLIHTCTCTIMELLGRVEMVQLLLSFPAMYIVYPNVVQYMYGQLSLLKLFFQDILVIGYHNVGFVLKDTLILVFIYLFLFIQIFIIVFTYNSTFCFPFRSVDNNQISKISYPNLEPFFGNNSQLVHL